MSARSPFEIVNIIFPRISEELTKELNFRIPQQIFTKEEIGFLTLLLVKGVRITNGHYRMSFDEEFGTVEMLSIEDFISSHQEIFPLYFQRMHLEKINQQLRSFRKH